MPMIGIAELLSPQAPQTLTPFRIRGWIRVVPEPFTSDSKEIAYQLYFAEPIRYVEVRSVYGYGKRYD